MWFLITFRGKSLRKQIQALGRLKTGQMNKTESAYCQHLEMRKRAGEIVWYRFEGIKLRLADDAFLYARFRCDARHPRVDLHEVKVFWTDDARVKTKVAADQYPFRIIGVTVKPRKAGGGWNIEEF